MPVPGLYGNSDCGPQRILYFDLAPPRHAASKPDWRGVWSNVRRAAFWLLVVVVVVAALGAVVVVVVVGFGVVVLLVEAVFDVEPQFQKLFDVDLGLAVVVLAAAVVVVAGLAFIVVVLVLVVLVLVVVLGFFATVAVDDVLGLAVVVSPEDVGLAAGVM